MPVITHTHVVGTGVIDYGELGIFPVQVNNDDDLQKMIANKHGYRSIFSYASEQVEPAYYQVYLDMHKIKAELTATEQVGIHRYSFDNFNEKQTNQKRNH
jgi:putative alpha-1,2-mannosidase